MNGFNRVCQGSPEPGRSVQQRPNTRVLTPEYPAPTRLHSHLRGARALVQREQGGGLSCRNPGRLLRGGAFRSSWAEKLTECVHRTGSRRPEAQKLRQGSDQRGCTRTDSEARREPRSSRITSGQLASGTGPVLPDSMSQQPPRRLSEDIAECLRKWVVILRPLVPRPLASCTPCPGLFPTRLLSPADSLPSGATPAGVEQRRRAETTTKHPSQDQEFPGCPTDYFRSLVPTLPLAPSPESPATSPRPCTLASGGEWG